MKKGSDLLVFLTLVKMGATFAGFYGMLWLADHYPMTVVVGVAAAIIFFVGTNKTGDL